MSSVIIINIEIYKGRDCPLTHRAKSIGIVKPHTTCHIYRTINPMSAIATSFKYTKLTF